MAMKTQTPSGSDDPAEADAGSGGASGEADAESGTVDRLPLDVIFDVLKNRRRRLVLQYTREHDEEPFTLSDIAEYIAAEENDKPIAQLTSDERKRVYVGLYQCHLPRMDDAGVLEFDRNRGTVEMNDAVEQLEPYLNVNDGGDGRRWPVYYGGATAVGVVLYGAAAIPAVPLTFPVAMFVVLVTFGCCSGLHGLLES